MQYSINLVCRNINKKMGDEDVKTPADGTQCPTVGRVVYYKSRGSADGVYPKVDRAAIVTQIVDKESLVIGVCVLNPTGIFFAKGIKNGQEGGMWDWMPFQKDQQKRYADTEQKEKEEKEIAELAKREEEEMKEDNGETKEPEGKEEPADLEAEKPKSEKEPTGKEE